MVTARDLISRMKSESLERSGVTTGSECITSRISRETEPPEEQVILPSHLLYFGGISQRSRPVHDKDPVFYSN
jgi:hypothetical protein